jgi:hypothetical protein
MLHQDAFPLRAHRQTGDHNPPEVTRQVLHRFLQFQSNLVDPRFARSRLFLASIHHP